MTKAERTRMRIVEKTAPVFNKKGYEGTTLADLTEATGLTKGALYGNFQDKEEIAAEAFKYSITKVQEVARKHVASSFTYRDKLSALFDFYASYVFNPPIPGGCPLLNTCVEADDHRTAIRRVVVRELTSTIDFISALVEGGVKTKEFRPDIAPREVAYTFFCVLEGALLFSRIERSREPMDIVVRHCQKVLDNICN